MGIYLCLYNLYAPYAVLPEPKGLWPLMKETGAIDFSGAGYDALLLIPEYVADIAPHSTEIFDIISVPGGKCMYKFIYQRNQLPLILDIVFAANFAS